MYLCLYWTLSSFYLYKTVYVKSLGEKSFYLDSLLVSIIKLEIITITVFKTLSVLA